MIKTNSKRRRENQNESLNRESKCLHNIVVALEDLTGLSPPEKLPQ